MATLILSERFDFSNFDIFDAFEDGTITPDAQQPSMKFVAETTGFELEVQGTGFTYNSDNQPVSGTTKAIALYDTDEGVRDDLIFTFLPTAPGITALKTFQYLNQTPEMVLQDLFKGNDVIRGSDFASAGEGGDSDDINGLGGNDTLIGNGGKDTFHFTTKLGADNVDTIRDFRHFVPGSLESDKVSLDSSIFKGVNQGNLKFTFKNTTAENIDTGKGLDGNDYILYDRNTGFLYYDKDGYGDGNAQGKGGSDPIKFAVLSAPTPNGQHPEFNILDIVIESQQQPV